MRFAAGHFGQCGQLFLDNGVSPQIDYFENAPGVGFVEIVLHGLCNHIKPVGARFEVGH